MSENRNVFEESAEVLAKVHQLVMDGDALNARINEFSEHARAMSKANAATNEALEATAANLKKSVNESHERMDKVIGDVTEGLKELKAETQTSRSEHQAIVKELQIQNTKSHDNIMETLQALKSEAQTARSEHQAIVKELQIQNTKSHDNIMEGLQALKSEAQTARSEHHALLTELQTQTTKLHDKQNELTKFVYINLSMVILFGLGTILFLALK